MDANGVAYFLSDDGQGPAVLLLHGFPDTSNLWRNQIPALIANGFRVIAPDLRGRGQTQILPNVADYAIPAMVPDLLAILDALNINKANIVGHDFGAGLAWVFAALHPERVEKLVALSVGHPAARGRPTLAHLQKAWYQILFQFEGIAEDLIQQDDWYLFRELLQTNPDLDAYIADLARPGALTAALNWYRAGMPLKRLLSTSTRLPAVQAPTLGIWSAGDHYLTEDRMLASEKFVDNTWRYERIDDASHWIPLDAPERLNQLLLEFLR